MKSNLRNEIKSYIVRQGMTMQEVVDLLRDEHGWSDSVSNLSNKLQRESLRYVEAVQLADALGYEIVWQRKKNYSIMSMENRLRISWDVSVLKNPDRNTSRSMTIRCGRSTWRSAN